MTQEDKQLLLKDLSTRLSYGVKIRMIHHEIKGADPEYVDDVFSTTHYNMIDYDDDNYEFLPYLRPMSSMTEEEKRYIDNRWGADNYGDIITYSSYEGGMSTVELADITGFQDWLNAHHFDYRNLIEKGLAFEAPEGMYKKDNNESINKTS